MLKIDGKVFLNIQEAVGWLMANNALPFQCTANYVADTEIPLSDIVNPSPAKVRIGSIIFFADSKVSTVIGLTENGFICSDKYNNLVDDIAYVTGVSINGSGHLITTLSDGQTIDAGIIKQVSNFSINGSQHLIVNYNDGTSTDLGAIFSGSITISGNLTVTGGISGNAITGDSIIENMSGYSVAIGTNTYYTYEKTYFGVVKNGNKLTIVLSANMTKDDAAAASNPTLAVVTLPSSVASKLIPTNIGGSNLLDVKENYLWSGINSNVSARMWMGKEGNNIRCAFTSTGNMVVGTTYYVRYEATFLLSGSL